MDEIRTLTFKWETGHIDIARASVLDMNAAQLKKFLKAATINRAEMEDEIRDFINEEIAVLDPKACKKLIENCKKLLAVVEGKKQMKAEKIAAKIVKSVEFTRPDFNGYIENAGKFCILDGYRLIRFSAIPGGIEKAPGTFNAAKAVGEISAYSVKLTLPVLKELKQDIKIAKAGKTSVGHVHVDCNKRVMYDFGYGLPMVNAQYLADMIEALPDCEAFCNPEKGIVSSVYFAAGCDDGIIMPIRKDGEYEKAPEEVSADVAEKEEQKAESQNTENQEAETVESAESVETAKTMAEQDTANAVENAENAEKTETVSTARSEKDGIKEAEPAEIIECGKAELETAEITEVTVIHPAAVSTISAVACGKSRDVGESAVNARHAIQKAGNMNSRSGTIPEHSGGITFATAALMFCGPLRRRASNHPKAYTPPGIRSAAHDTS